MDHRTVRVYLTRRGEWEVALPDRPAQVVCGTVDEASRVGYLHAAHRHPCHLVVRDAYHRVLHQEYIDG